MDTAASPPNRIRRTFIRIEVILPAMLFRKFGLPQAKICLTIRKLKRGRHSLSWSFPRAKGTKAKRAARAMPVQVARAAAQIPQPKTYRKRNSRITQARDIKIFSSMLRRTLPQIRR